MYYRNFIYVYYIICLHLAGAYGLWLRCCVLLLITLFGWPSEKRAIRAVGPFIIMCVCVCSMDGCKIWHWRRAIDSIWCVCVCVFGLAFDTDVSDVYTWAYMV